MSKELKTLLEFDKLTADNMSKMKETYAALAIEPDHTPAMAGCGYERDRRSSPRHCEM